MVVGHQGFFWSFSFPLVFWLAFIALDDVTVGIFLVIVTKERFFF
jgi:hypothetical protein